MNAELKVADDLDEEIEDDFEFELFSIHCNCRQTQFAASSTLALIFFFYFYLKPRKQKMPNKQNTMMRSGRAERPRRSAAKAASTRMRLVRFPF